MTTPSNDQQRPRRRAAHFSEAPKTQAAPMPSRGAVAPRQAGPAPKARAATNRRPTPRGGRDSSALTTNRMSGAAARATRRAGSHDVRREKTKHRGGAGFVIGGVAIAAVVLLAVVLVVIPSLTKSGGDTQQIEVGQVVNVTIPDGAGAQAVAQALFDAKTIESKSEFLKQVSRMNAGESLKSGNYVITVGGNLSNLVELLTTGPNASGIALTIPEGYTVEEIFKLMENKGVCSYNDLLKVAQEETFDFDFLKDVKTSKEKRLEGYLFPDTYEFYKGADAKSVINTMLKNFDERFDSKMEAEMQLLGYSKNDIIIMASIIEKETDGGDQRNIASVLQNRLKNTWATPKGYLQVDSTIQYLLKERKKKLTDKDLEIDSPYNTYKNPGLPIGPICNPGLTAIQAALEPNKTNYYYFMLGKDGTTHFFDTEAAFLAFKAEQQD